MITLSVFFILVIVSFYLIFTKKDFDGLDKVLFSVIALVCWGLVYAFIGYPVMRSFEGLMPGYSVGVREGYLTKLSTKGVIFDTNEAQLQIGTGQMSALQEPWQFSIPDAELNREARELLGQRVRVNYSEWLVGPFRLGETSYIAVSIEPISE